ncbi:UNVERIFIED_CONTAM: hypothetical protein Sradi_7162100 [Sesamum radiatum]|uniref:Zinc knuckle CX2CX4HX4C domain-containing protein n=1 Tax=Sesamum radiatum TaxID=300843 RepID=A0AAW2IUI5_SESRA
MEYWTNEGLSVVVSGVGKPLYSDAVTKQCSRLDYARVCVMLDYNSTLPKHLVIISPVLRDGKEVPVRVDIEYEWLPQRCKDCQSLGHNAVSCPEKKRNTEKKSVEVYIKKTQSTAEVEKKQEEEQVQHDEVVESELVSNEMEHGLSYGKQGLVSGNKKITKGESSKGKDIVLYNQFTLLHHDTLGESGNPTNNSELSGFNTGPIQSSPIKVPP